MNSLLWFKIAIIVINPLETALGALIPACLKRSKRNAERLMACAAAAAAGIFLGVGLCHMLDDATHFLEVIQPRFHGFPLALFCCCLGFSLLLLLDKIVFASHHHHHHHHHTTTTAEDDSTPLVINDHGHTHEETHALVKAVLVTVGIAVHSAVSGLATGVARDMTTLTMLAIACFAHDWSHASALVIMFDELRISRRAVVSLLVAFIVRTPPNQPVLFSYQTNNRRQRSQHALALASLLHQLSATPPRRLSLACSLLLLLACFFGSRSWSCCARPLKRSPTTAFSSSAFSSFSWEESRPLRQSLEQQAGNFEKDLSRKIF